MFLASVDCLGSPLSTPRAAVGLGASVVLGGVGEFASVLPFRMWLVSLRAGRLAWSRRTSLLLREPGHPSSWGSVLGASLRMPVVTARALEPFPRISLSSGVRASPARRLGN